MTDALIRATLRTWPFGDRKPLDCGVEDGIVWAIIPAPFCGINGYAVIPAEGHPWSKGWPREGDEGYQQGLDDLLDVQAALLTLSIRGWGSILLIVGMCGRALSMTGVGGPTLMVAYRGPVPGRRSLWLRRLRVWLGR